MAVESLFQITQRLRWDAEKMTATCGPGISARVWKSVVSAKLVLTVDMPGGITRSGRVSGLDEAKVLAEEWLREEGYA